MKIILAGGSGYLGNALINHYLNIADEIVVLSRKKSSAKGNVRVVQWDGKSVEQWKYEMENADMLINLTGKNVNCRYHEKNKREILESRLNSVCALGEAIKDLQHPPKLWLQSSSATIYRHSEDKIMDEENGELGHTFSEEVCKQWEETFWQLNIPYTRKVVLRAGIVLGAGGSALPRLITLVKSGLGGKQGNGSQFVSWLHEKDFVNIVEWIRTHPLVKGTFNGTSPNPIRNDQFMKTLRMHLNIPVGLPIPQGLLELGAMIIGTETELVLKSRWVVPKKLLESGFQFQFPTLGLAFRDLLVRTKAEEFSPYYTR